MLIETIIIMYYKDLVETITDILKHFKGVNYVTYTGDDFINSQHNYNTIQCWLDNISISSYNLTNNVNKVEFQLYILGFGDNTPDAILTMQDECYNVAVNVLAYLDYMPQYRGHVSLYDWSILTLDKFTAQNNAGVKVSIVLNVESPINLCQIDNWFNDEPYEEEKDKEIDIKKINLPKSNVC